MFLFQLMTKIRNPTQRPLPLPASTIARDFPTCSVPPKTQPYQLMHRLTKTCFIPLQPRSEYIVPCPQEYFRPALTLLTS